MEIGKAVEIGEAMDTTASSKDRTAFQVLENTRKEVEEIVSKMVQIKKENKSKSQLRELITQASLNFLTLRQAQIPLSLYLSPSRVYKNLITPSLSSSSHVDEQGDTAEWGQSEGRNRKCKGSCGFHNSAIA